jgi:hypothetical protein
MRPLCWLGWCLYGLYPLFIVPSKAFIHACRSLTPSKILHSSPIVGFYIQVLIELEVLIDTSIVDSITSHHTTISTFDSNPWRHRAPPKICSMLALFYLYSHLESARLAWSRKKTLESAPKPPPQGLMHNTTMCMSESRLEYLNLPPESSFVV